LYNHAIDLSQTHALLLAARGRDAQIGSALLRDVGINARSIATLNELVTSLSDQTLFVAVTEEHLRFEDLREIAEWVHEQPAWSDLPFLILTQRITERERLRDAERLTEILRNVTFLERPFHPTTFVSVVRSAVKTRTRQYDTRARMQELHRLNVTLEDRVKERTSDLMKAHALAMEENAQRLRAETLLRQSQKMELVGQLTGGVAHDFNNLLMAIIGNLDLLRRRFPTDEKSARLIEGAMIGAKRGAALTQRLLAFARRQELDVEPRSIVDLVRGMSDLILRSVGRQTEVIFDLPKHVPLALLDANQVELALLNLVVNARDAMLDGGQIIIAVDVARSDMNHELAVGDYIRLSVTDTGHGMDENTLKRATEPFFSTKEVGKGTGLGLSMIHGLALQLNGALRLISVVNQGTRAELWFPVTKDFVAPKPAATMSINSVGSEKMTILVVDDDALISMSTVDMLEDLGHEVVECNSAAAALEVLRQKNNIDLMITDFAMPRMNGAQLAQAARHVKPDLPILLATGYAELPADFDLGLPRLSKPYQQDDLAKEIAKIRTANVSTVVVPP
jgi:signal transduction histidine kinase/ActR/RegA family two-component response regulator